MSQRRRRGRASGGWLSRLALRHVRHARQARTLAIGGFRVAMIAAFFVVLALQTGHPQQSSDGWVSLSSTSPDDVRAAASATPTFRDVLHAQTPLGATLRAGTLGTPALVRAYHRTASVPDVWVIPVYAPSSQASSGGSSGESASAPVALLDFAADSAGSHLHALTFAGPFTPGDPTFQRPFPRLTADQAVATLRSARGRGLAAGQRPELVYFPADLDRIASAPSGSEWTGGGQFPDLAIWRLPADDGRDYLVGVDAAVYTPAQLPLAPGT